MTSKKQDRVLKELDMGIIPYEMTYGLAEMYSKNKEKDGIINGTEGKTRTEYIVFKSEQIHILGSKQDIEGFK
jgi:hypothetical protein